PAPAPSPAPAPAPAPTPAPAPPSGSPAASGPKLENCDMFPASAIFNTRIDDTSKFPAQANSAWWVSMVGSSTPFTANWGVTDNADDVAYYGIPYNVVDDSAATTGWPLLSYNFALSGVN